MALKHSLNIQQPFLNKQPNWTESLGVGERVKKGKADGPAICLKEKVTAPLCSSDRRAIQQEEKGKVVKKRKAGRPLEQLQQTSTG